MDDPVSFVVWTAVGSGPRIALTLSERGGWATLLDGWTLARDPALPASEVCELELPVAVWLPEPAPPAELPCAELAPEEACDALLDEPPDEPPEELLEWLAELPEFELLELELLELELELEPPVAGC